MDHHYTTQAALAIPEKQNESNGEQDNEANDQKDHRHRRSDTRGVRRDIK